MRARRHQLPVGSIVGAPHPHPHRAHRLVHKPAGAVGGGDHAQPARPPGQEDGHVEGYPGPGAAAADAPGPRRGNARPG